MDTDFLYKPETDNILGSAFAVLNEVGHGFHEKPYENGLVVEFTHREIPYVQQPRYPMLYRGVKISEFIPDLVAFGKIIVDTKVIERITDLEIGKMLNYLKITGLPLGLILNFKNPKLEIRRVSLTTQSFIRRKSADS
jgi:GxxExxY protein